VIGGVRRTLPTPWGTGDVTVRRPRARASVCVGVGKQPEVALTYHADADAATLPARNATHDLIANDAVSHLDTHATCIRTHISASRVDQHGASDSQAESHITTRPARMHTHREREREHGKPTHRRAHMADTHTRAHTQGRNDTDR
jgi:hypothetical protein